MDFQSTIDKYKKNNGYANFKVTSFTYWAWAKLHQGNSIADKRQNILKKP